MSTVNNKLYVISQVLNQNLIEQLLRPLNNSFYDKRSAFNKYKKRDNLEDYVARIKQNYLNSAEELNETSRCEVLAYLGMAYRSDYLNQFNNVCLELENRSIEVSRHYTRKNQTTLQEKDVILSKSMLLFAKHICETLNIYKYVAGQGDYFERDFAK